MEENSKIKVNKIVNITKFAVNLFLLIAICLLIYQFFKADKITRDIALYDSPNGLISLYENLTGNQCVCNYNKIKGDTINQIDLSNLVPK